MDRFTMIVSSNKMVKFFNLFAVLNALQTNIDPKVLIFEIQFEPMAISISMDRTSKYIPKSHLRLINIYLTSDDSSQSNLDSFSVRAHEMLCCLRRYYSDCNSIWSVCWFIDKTLNKMSCFIMCARMLNAQIHFWNRPGWKPNMRKYNENLLCNMY